MFASSTKIAALLDTGFDKATRAHEHKTRAQKQILAQLDRERDKLLQLFYSDDLDEDQFKAEQARIREERGAATKQLNAITNTREELNTKLEKALGVMTNCGAAYQRQSAKVAANSTRLLSKRSS